MKILVICQYYYPEPFRISDICEELVHRGHEVTVITGIPNYPEGKIYKDYKNRQRRKEVINGVNVLRCSTIPRKSGVAYRFLNYYSYSIASTNYVKKLDNNYDVVLINQLSPVMMADAGIAYSKMHKKPCVLYCLDLWPESLVAGGIGRESALFKHYSLISQKVYQAVDRLLVTSKMFIDYLSDSFNIDKNRIGYLPQYAESFFNPIEISKSKESFNFAFAGNIGEIQSLETIINAAEILKNEPICWHIIGNGSDLERIKNLTKRKTLKNIVFYGRKPVEEMPNFYAMADAMLVTLKADKVSSLTLPGKVQSYMAAGKPIIGAINGETKSVIEEANCGFCGEAENSVLLADNIHKFMNFTNKKQLGINARNYYETHFTKNRFMNALENELIEILENHHESISI